MGCGASTVRAAESPADQEQQPLTPTKAALQSGPNPDPQASVRPAQPEALQPPASSNDRVADIPTSVPEASEAPSSPSPPPATAPTTLAPAAMPAEPEPPPAPPPPPPPAPPAEPALPAAATPQGDVLPAPSSADDSVHIPGKRPSGRLPPLKSASAAQQAAAPAAAGSGGCGGGAPGSGGPSGEVAQRASDLTAILAARKQQAAPGPGPPASASASPRPGSALDADDEEALRALLFGVDTFPDLVRELGVAPAQVLLPSGACPDDAAGLQSLSGCSGEEAVRLLDAMGVIAAAAEALGADGEEEEGEEEAGARAAAGQPPAAPPPPSAKPAVAGPGAAGGGLVVRQLTRQLANLASLVNAYPGLRSAAMTRGALPALLRILLRQPEAPAAANAALALAALAAGPAPHKTALVAGGAVDGALRAMRGGTAAAAAGEDASGVVSNAANALANLVTSHSAGAAAVAAANGIGTLLGAIEVRQPAGVRTNAAGALVQLTAVHESYRGAVVAAGGVAALAAALLRGPDAPACNAAGALYNLAALSPPNLRPQMAAPDGPLSIVRPLLLCMAGRGSGGAADETVAASPAARTNASAILLELAKDPAAAPRLMQQAVPSALATLAAGRLPPPLPPATKRAHSLAAAAAASPAPPAEAADTDPVSGGLALLYPVPGVVRGNCLLALMALARLGPGAQLELGRCGALGALLELAAPGQEAALQVNAVNCLCSLAAANADIHAALVAARCVALLAGLLGGAGDAARANVCAVFATMMRDPEARRQLQECGGLTSLVRMTAALLDQRAAAGGAPGSAADPGGLLCNGSGALAEAARHADLRRALLQIEFGEAVALLLRCLREGPEPAQVNAAAALCHLCRERAGAAQLGRLGGQDALQAVVGAGDSQPPPGVSSRLRHNASRALARLTDQLAAVEAEAEQAAAERAAGAAAGRSGEGGGEAAGAGNGGEEAEGGFRPAPSHAAWGQGAEQSGQTTADSAVGGGPVGSHVEGGDDEADDVSTVIAAPMPLTSY